MKTRTISTGSSGREPGGGNDFASSGVHWDSSDPIELGLPNDDERLLEILVDCLGDEPWCDRNPYAQREDERLVSSWERFSEFIKYKRRNFFFQKDEDKLVAPGEYLSASELLNFIGETAKTLDLLKTLPVQVCNLLVCNF